MSLSTWIASWFRHSPDNDIPPPRSETVPVAEAPEADVSIPESEIDAAFHMLRSEAGSEADEIVGAALDALSALRGKPLDAAVMRIIREWETFPPKNRCALQSARYLASSGPDQISEFAENVGEDTAAEIVMVALNDEEGSAALAASALEGVKKQSSIRRAQSVLVGQIRGADDARRLLISTLLDRRGNSGTARLWNEELAKLENEILVLLNSDDPELLQQGLDVVSNLPHHSSAAASLVRSLMKHQDESVACKATAVRVSMLAGDFGALAAELPQYLQLGNEEVARTALQHAWAWYQETARESGAERRADALARSLTPFLNNRNARVAHEVAELLRKLPANLTGVTAQSIAPQENDDPTSPGHFGLLPKIPANWRSSDYVLAVIRPLFGEPRRRDTLLLSTPSPCPWDTSLSLLTAALKEGKLGDFVQTLESISSNELALKFVPRMLEISGKIVGRPSMFHDRRGRRETNYGLSEHAVKASELLRALFAFPWFRKQMLDALASADKTLNRRCGDVMERCSATDAVDVLKAFAQRESFEHYDIQQIDSIASTVRFAKSKALSELAARQLAVIHSKLGDHHQSEKSKILAAVAQLDIVTASKLTEAKPAVDATA